MLKDIRDFYFKWQVWEIRTKKPRKNVVIKHRDSSMSKERYQADTVLLPNYVTQNPKTPATLEALEL